MEQSFSLDHLSETEFEQFCYDLLKELGFTNLNWRKGTGLSSSPSDRGRDIECQFLQEGVSGRTYLETWFIECKHYKQGVPPDKIQGALAWASAKKPDKLLIIVSNFLSNPTKDFIEELKQNKPSYKIEVWERPDIERLTSGMSVLLRKYKIGGDFPFLSLMHPAHLAYLHSIPINTLDYLFGCLDGLEEEKREHFVGWVTEIILQPRYREPITGKESMASLRIDEVNYEVFKKKCYEIIGTGVIDQMILTYFIVSFTLQSFFKVGDINEIDTVVTRYKGFIKYLEGEIKKRPSEKERLTRMIEHNQEDIKIIPARIKRNYEEYVYFCEHVISKLLAEQYLRS